MTDYVIGGKNIKLVAPNLAELADYTQSKKVSTKNVCVKAQTGGLAPLSQACEKGDLLKDAATGNLYCKTTHTQNVYECPLNYMYDSGLKKCKYNGKSVNYVCASGYPTQCLNGTKGLESDGTCQGKWSKDTCTCTKQVE